MELIDDKGQDSYDCNADNDGEKVEEEGDDDDDHAVEPDEEDKGGHRQMPCYLHGVPIEELFVRV